MPVLPDIPIAHCHYIITCYCSRHEARPGVAVGCGTEVVLQGRPPQIPEIAGRQRELFLELKSEIQLRSPQLARNQGRQHSTWWPSCGRL
jgi:hypothetical protein